MHPAILAPVLDVCCASLWFTLAPMANASGKKVALFWPGDARAKPNELAAPNMEEATTQLERALKKLGRAPYRVEGFLSKPHESIEKLGPIGGEMRRLLADPAEIDRILAAGAERANAIAAPTMAEVRKLVGYWAG